SFGGRNGRFCRRSRSQQFGNEDSTQNQGRAGERSPPKPLVVENKRSQSRKYGFQCKNNRRMVCAGVLLRPHLHGKSHGGGENSRRNHGRNQSRRPKQAWLLRSYPGEKRNT